ncbi:MAG: HDOD domain-containing protein [Desulfobacteraceae bacterium]|nr:HDOD domain-containing protein [Desulfobacteraceae bacterium]
MQPDKNHITHLEHALANDDALPVLHPTALKIQMEATKKDPHFSVLASLICKDPTMTSRVLKVANSPYYRGIEEAQTLKDALTRLGQNEIVNIIMALIHQQHFRSKHQVIQPLQRQLWHHCVNCAIGTLWTARHLGFKELVPLAFIAGLLHDMGKLHILSALEYVLTTSEENIQFPATEIDNIIDELHPSLGYHLLTRWGLPRQYRTIARDHHCKPFDMSDKLLVIVRLVNELCNSMEQNGTGSDYTFILEMSEARILKLSEPEIHELEMAVKTDMALR